jgi:hypothetical protein
MQKFLESMYLPASSRINNERILTVRNEIYLPLGRYGCCVADNERGANYLKRVLLFIPIQLFG